MGSTIPRLVMAPYPCEEATETAVPRGKVPHFLPGQSPLPGLKPDLTDRFGTPYDARLGGPETMYPEYIAKMKNDAAPAGTGSFGIGGPRTMRPLTRWMAASRVSDALSQPSTSIRRLRRAGEVMPGHRR